MTNLETGRISDRHPPYRYAALSRVWFSDTDAQGVVYYGRYLPYFDNARLEYLRHLGLVGSGRATPSSSCGRSRSSTTRRPTSTTSSRSSSGRRGSAAPASPPRARPTASTTTA